MTRPNLTRRPPRHLDHRIDLATNGICVAVEGNSLAQVEKLARRVKAVMAEHQAAEALHQQARGGVA